MSLANPESRPTQTREEEMDEHWQKDLAALEEEPPRRPGRLRLVVLVLILAGLAYGLWELRNLRVMLAELQTLRAQNAELNTRLEVLERRVSEPPVHPALVVTSEASMRPAQSDPAEPTLTTFEHVVKRGETLWEIAKRHGVEIKDLRRANPDLRQDVLFAGQEIAIPSEVFYVTVKPGDTLSALAAKYHVPLQSLMKANRLKDPDHLPLGARLLIPSEPAPPGP